MEVWPCNATHDVSVHRFVQLPRCNTYMTLPTHTKPDLIRMAMGAFFFRGHPLTDNVNIKIRT